MNELLPIGIQSFENIIDYGYLYIDKTKYVYDLVRRPKGVHFLHRPRRFGKSLLMSTLKALFEGKQELFQNLYIHSTSYTFAPHPIIYLDFSKVSASSLDVFRLSLHNHLNQLAREHGLIDHGITAQDNPFLLDSLIYHLRGQRPVILIDEYDAPIINNLAPEKLERAKAIREELKAFFATIKANDDYLRFVFLTGISKFSKVGVFSGLNNLNDISMSPQYAHILGIHQTELEHHFSDGISKLARQQHCSLTDIQAKIRQWYNGFCFVPHTDKLYNPISIFKLLDSQRFDNYWFQTATPTFLIEQLKQQHIDISVLEQLSLSKHNLDSYDLEHPDIHTILFQTGYLTIQDVDDFGDIVLSYPNQEVRESFLKHLLSGVGLNRPSIALTANKAQ